MTTQSSFLVWPLRFSIFLLMSWLALTNAHAATTPFRWYYHTSDKNETKTAFRAAIDNQCGLLAFIGKPGCSVCNAVWSKSYSGHKMLDGTGEMADFLEANKLVGLFIEDSQQHFGALANGASGYKSILDGPTTRPAAPFLVLVKIKDTERNDSSLDLLKKTSDIEIFFGRYGSTNMYDLNYEAVTTWLKKVLVLDAYREACPGVAAENPPADLVELDFWAGTPENPGLATMTRSGVECYSTNDAVRSVATSLVVTSSKEQQRWFKFSGKSGRRYVFSLNKGSGQGAPTLDELVAKNLDFTCTVYSIGNNKEPSTVIAQKKVTGKGLKALDEGFFFVPDNPSETNYYLCLSTTTALTEEIPFALKYHYSEIAEEGSLGIPLWKGAPAGQWTMDYEAAVASKEPFLLYFGGETWCPSCISFERLVSQSEGFKTAVAGYPLVVLDNRRRGETTGPSLLYAEDYQNYVHSASVDPEANLEEKLKENMRIQNSNLEPGQVKVNYPSLLFCQGQENGSLRVISRVDFETPYPFGIWYAPTATADFSDFGAKCIERLVALETDEAEEKDNYASTTSAKVTPADDTASGEVTAKIGGYDMKDWRILHLDSTHSWRFAVAGDEFDPAATVAIGLYDELGTGAADGNLLARVAGTGAALPHLDFVPDELRSDTEWNCRLKVSVDGQDDVVDYQLVYSDLEPYDVGFNPETGKEIMVRQKDVNEVALTAVWQRTKQTGLQGKVVVELEGPGACEPDYSFGIGEDDSGMFDVTITGLGNVAPSASPAVTTVTLKADGNCRVDEKNHAVVIKTYSLPAFVGEEGDSKDIPVFENTDFEMKLPVFNGLTDITNFEFINGSERPDGVELSIEPGVDGNANLVLKGRIAEACDPVTIRLLTDEGQPGATLELVFKMTSLAQVNPVAAATEKFTGYLSLNNRVAGVFTLERKEDKSFTVELSQVNPQRSISGIAAGWSVVDSESGMVTTTAVLDDSTEMDLRLTNEGVGNGSYGDATVSFLPNMSDENEIGEYTGHYNVKLEGTHPKYCGYGWVTLDIDGNGIAAYSGILPDGSEFDGTIALVGENNAAHCTILASEETEGGYVCGRLQITPRTERSDDTPVPCISSCENKPLLDFCWFDAGNNMSISLSACGTEFEKGKSFKEQTAQRSLFLYLVSTDLELPQNCPEGVSPLFLPSGVAIEEVSEGGRFQLKSDAFDGAAARPYQDLAGLELTYDETGRFSGGFLALSENGEGIPLSLSGVLTPIPAACCGGVDAVAYGRVCLSGDDSKSWPICIMGDFGLSADVIEDLFPQVPEVAVENGNLKATGADPDLSGYVLLDSDGGVVAVSSTGMFALEELPGSEYQVALVANGLVGEERASVTLGFALELPSTVFEGFGEEAAANTPSGWLAYAMPECKFLEDVPVTPEAEGALMVVFFYPEGVKAPVRATMWNELQPGQAFWVFFNKAAVGTSRKLIDANVVSVPKEASEPSGEFVFQVAPPELPADADFWTWQNDSYRKGENGIGWLKMQKSSSSAEE